VSVTSAKEPNSKVFEEPLKIAKGKGNVYKSEKPFSSKNEIMTLEKEASKFMSFILPSIQNQNKAHFVKEISKNPRIEEDLYATNTSGYVLDLDKSSNLGESIRI